MTEQQWLTSTDSREMLKFLATRDPPSARRLRLFAIAVARRAWALLQREQFRQMIEMAERFADGEVSEQQMLAIRGPEPEDLPWGVRDVAYMVTVPPATFGLEVASRVTAHVALALGDAAYPDADFNHDDYLAAAEVREGEYAVQAVLLRCILGLSPFRAVTLDPSWRTPTVRNLAHAAADDRDLPSGELAADHLAVLADALEDAGCTSTELLAHLRSPGPHGHGCWALDLLLGKE
jgi:hypothetical protein